LTDGNRESHAAVNEKPDRVMSTRRPGWVYEAAIDESAGVRVRLIRLPAGPILHRISGGSHEPAAIPHAFTTKEISL